MQLFLTAYCSLKLKKNKKKTSLSSLIKQIFHTLSLSLSLSLFFLLSSSNFFFSLARRPTLSPIADLPKPHHPIRAPSPASTSPAQVDPSPKPPIHASDPRLRLVLRSDPCLHPVLRSDPRHLSILFVVIEFVCFVFLMYFHMGLVAVVVVVDFGYSSGG